MDRISNHRRSANEGCMADLDKCIWRPQYLSVFFYCDKAKLAQSCIFERKEIYSPWLRDWDPAHEMNWDISVSTCPDSD